MKCLKEYFHMLISAVICLAMSLIPGKNRGKSVKLPGEGGIFFGNWFSGNCVGQRKLPGCVSVVPEDKVIVCGNGNTAFDSDAGIRKMLHESDMGKRKKLYESDVGGQKKLCFYVRPCHRQSRVTGL